MPPTCGQCSWACHGLWQARQPAGAWAAGAAGVVRQLGCEDRQGTTGSAQGQPRAHLAVATGAHLAWSLPVPLRAIALSASSCPRRILTSVMGSVLPVASFTRSTPALV